jgi:two-component system, NtrC family, sensor kinase
MKNSDNRKKVGQESSPLKLKRTIERLSAEEQLYRAAPLTATGAIVSGVVHEINNPLTAVLGFSSALIARAENNERIEKNELDSYLRVIHEEAVRCKDIMEHFHRFARDGSLIKDGRSSCAGCMAYAVRLVGSRAARAEIVIVNGLLESRPVRADASLLEQVFVSVLLNRIGCSDPGTAITISGLSGREDGTDGNTGVVISDRGHGLSAADLDFYFSTVRPGQGVVVGLRFCRRFIEENGGRFECSVNQEKGTAIILELPAVPE